MTRALAKAFLYGAARYLVEPRDESFFISKAAQVALNPNEDVLEHIVDFGRGHAPGNEGSKLLFELLVGGALTLDQLGRQRHDFSSSNLSIILF
jgi:hypothetical protein